MNPVYGIKYVVCQKEACPTTGTLHYQGYLFLDGHNGLGEISLRRRLPFLGDRRATRLVPSKGTAQQNKVYCTKPESRLAGPWEFGEIPSVGGDRSKNTLEEAIAALTEAGYDLQVLARSQPILFAKFHRQLEALAARVQPKPQVDFSAPRPWQQQIVDLVNTEPDSRSVNWIVDETGGQGKTYLSKYLIAEHDAFYTTGGKGADIVHAYNNQRVIIFDFSRDKDGFVSYAVIEQLKNGLVFSGKYNSAFKVRPHQAHVIVFSNFEPDQSKLSRDRWKITRLLPPTAQDPIALSLLGI